MVNMDYYVCYHVHEEGLAYKFVSTDGMTQKHVVGLIEKLKLMHDEKSIAILNIIELEEHQKSSSPRGGTGTKSTAQGEKEP